MNLAEIISDVKARAERDIEEGKAFLEQKLPTLSNLADKAAAIDAILEAMHLDPEWFVSLADLIRKADAALGVAVEARKTAEAAAAAATAPAEPDQATVEETAAKADAPGAPQPDVIAVPQA